MIERKKLSEKSIRKRYLKIIASIFGIMTVLSLLFFIYMYKSQEKMLDDHEKFEERAEIIDGLEDSYKQVVLHARGYYAFRNQNERVLLYNSLDNLEEQINKFSSLSLTEEERMLANDLRTFYSEYRYEILPTLMEYADENNIEGLQKASQGEIGDLINGFLLRIKNNHDQNVESYNQLHTDLLTKSNGYTYLAIILFGSALFILTIIMWVVITRIVRPIEELELATYDLVEGKHVSFPIEKHPDEIGKLMISFDSMAKTIQLKEEELLTQNEELQAQQLELEEHQDKLQTSLKENRSIIKALDQSAVVALMDDKGFIKEMNDMGSKLLQYNKSEVIGKSARNFIYDKLDVDLLSKIKQEIENNGIWQTDLNCKKKDGSEVCMNATIVPYGDNRVNEYSYIFIGIDISEIKKSQEELASLLDLAEKTKNRLERLNKLNHDLTFSLDQQELVDSIHHILLELYPSDKSIFWLINNEVYAAKGLEDKTIKLIIQDCNRINIGRLQEEQFYIIKREVSAEERGIAESSFYAYDLYSSVFGSNDEIIAVYCVTRLGTPFDSDEIDELVGILQRISLAFGRISMYQQIVDSRKLNQDILNNVNEGIQFVNPYGEMLQFNETLRTNILQSEWSHRRDIPAYEWLETFMEIAHPKKELMQFFQDAITQKTPRVMSSNYTIGESERKYINIYASPVYREQEKIGTIFVHRDITKEHEVDQMKSELVSTVSHELRTPLSSVLGFTELLLNKQISPERQQKYLSTIHKEANRLTNLINNFLDIQRMESGKQNYEMQHCRIDEIMMDVIHRFIHGKRHTLCLVDEAVEGTILGDKDRLNQVFTNLISNAIKFSPDGGNIEIKLMNEDQHLLISIKDEGLGIAEQDLQHLFQKFRRIDNSERRKIGGTGLGLAITKEIIDKHLGKIWIESEEGVGTTVFLKLPLSEQLTEPTDTTMIDHTGINVIIVEDDPSIALLLSEELKRKGFNVIHFYNPEKAYEAAQTIPLVGIVIDLMLGEDMNGWDLIKKLKSSEKTKSLPIIISSALDKEENNVNQYKIEKYLTKPYPPEELSKTIHAFVRASKDGGNGEVLFPKVN